MTEVEMAGKVSIQEPKKGPRDCRLDKANFLYFTLVG